MDGVKNWKKIAENNNRCPRFATILIDQAGKSKLLTDNECIEC